MGFVCKLLFTFLLYMFQRTSMQRYNKYFVLANISENFVEVRGIEPLFSEPKSDVLPLDDTSITKKGPYLAFLQVQRYELFSNMQNIFRNLSHCTFII